jgi:VanZ family protein
MKNLRHLLLCYWLPPLAWMGMIFYLSAQSGLPDFKDFDFAVKKLAHATVYGILYLLLFRAIHSAKPEWEIGSIKVALGATLATIVYAISDEIHQSFVPFRTPAVRDVIIDALGVAIAWGAMRMKPAFFAVAMRKKSCRTETVVDPGSDG